MNGVIYVAGRSVLTLPAGVAVVTPGDVVMSTLAGATIGAAGLAALTRHARRPLTSFRRVALVVGGLSLLGPLAAAVGLVSDGPGVSASTFVLLALMNLATTAAIAWLLHAAAAVRDEPSGLD